MSEKIVNIGIIGTGKLGTYHLEKLQNISNCNLIGIYDINQDTLNEYERKYQVNICNSLEDLLAAHPHSRQELRWRTSFSFSSPTLFAAAAPIMWDRIAPCPSLKT